MTKTATLLCAAAMAALACGGALADEAAHREIDTARQAAARYADIEVALAEGFEQLFECTAHEKHGTMGMHFIHPGRAGDGRLVLEEPEVLMYEPQPDGSMQLVGVEYIVFEKDWTGRDAPRFLGQTLKRKTAVGRHEVDPFYEVHVWHWRHNPLGMFADWNPFVSCAHERG